MDNHILFQELLDKHLFFHPEGFGEDYDSKFTRFAQLYMIIKFFKIDFFKKGIHDENETLVKLIHYESKIIQSLGSSNEDLLFRDPISLTEEKEIIQFLLSLEPLK